MNQGLLTVTARRLEELLSRMRHAVGWPRLYRNGYSGDRDPIMELGIELGWIKEESKPSWAGGQGYFSVTLDGMKAMGAEAVATECKRNEEHIRRLESQLMDAGL